jgi:hypothetical protein
MPYHYEGVANSEEEDKIQHEAFYNSVEESTKKLGKNSRIMTKEQYNEIIEALSTVPRSTMTANQIRASYPSYYNWRNAYHVQGKCDSKRWKCVKEGVYCSSKCHSGNACCEHHKE